MFGESSRALLFVWKDSDVCVCVCVYECVCVGIMQTLVMSKNQMTLNYFINAHKGSNQQSTHTLMHTIPTPTTNNLPSLHGTTTLRRQAIITNIAQIQQQKHNATNIGWLGSGSGRQADSQPKVLADGSLRCNCTPNTKKGSADITTQWRWWLGCQADKDNRESL